jgi:glycosyltransferase involved in cell wall biosynthesis
MGKNNILILNSSIIYGGGEYFALKLSKQLKLMSYNVILGCKKDTPLFKKAISEDVEVKEISFPVKGSGRLRNVIKEIRNLISKHNIDIIHTNTNYDRTAGAFAGRSTQAKHITSCHSLESLSHNLTHYIRNKFLTEHFICDGQTIQDLIVKKNGVPIAKTTIINNGIDPAEMARDMDLRELIRHEFKIAPGEIVIGNTGRMVAFKGQKYLLLAFKDMLEKIQNVKLMIVGEGELMEDLTERANRLQISDRVVFTGFRDDLQAIYSSFDIYAHTSLKTGGELFPFSVLYAMAQGLPVASTDTGDISKMISKENLRFLAEERSPFQISIHLSELAKNQELRRLTGNSNLEKLKQQFTLERMVKRISEVYTKVINSSD